MKRIKYDITLWLSLILGISLNLSAQGTDPDSEYDQAMQMYNYGMADSALKVLQPYLDNKKDPVKISKERSAAIFRLAALSSIMTGNTSMAESYVRQLVTFQPDYKHHYREADLTEFRLMVDKVAARPSFRIGIMAGINFPFVTVSKKFSDYDSPADAFSINGNTGWQFDIFGEKALSSRISVEASAGITQILFQYITNDQAIHYQYNQKITYVEIPLVGRYFFLPEKPCKPYLEMGIFSRFSFYPRESSDEFGKYWYTESSNSDKILTTFETDIERIGFVAGCGATWDFPNISFRLDIRYNHNFRSSSKVSAFDNISGYDDISESEKFHYTDDINLINLKNIQISLGFMYNLKYKVF